MPKSSKLFTVIVASFVSQGMISTTVRAEQAISSADVVKALTPKFSNTRSLVATNNDDASVSAAERKFLDTIASQGLRFDAVKKVEEIVKEKKLPKLDMEIRFKFASAEISPSSHDDLKALADALRHPTLLNSRVLLNGHTDAKGSKEYNLKLSKERANAVRSFLTERYAIESKRLVAIGSGERRLKLKDAPTAEANRRVEIVNLGG